MAFFFPCLSLIVSLWECEGAVHEGDVILSSDAVAVNFLNTKMLSHIGHFFNAFHELEANLITFFFFCWMKNGKKNDK